MLCRMNRCLLIAVLLSFNMSCSSVPVERDYLPSGAPTELRGDYQAIQGTWTVVHNEMRLQTTPKLHGALHIFEGDRFRLGDESPPARERFVLDETTNPKRIDFDVDNPPRILGIYRLEGSRLIVCTGGPGEPRPTRFKTWTFNENILTVLERR